MIARANNHEIYNAISTENLRYIIKQTLCRGELYKCMSASFKLNEKQEIAHRLNSSVILSENRANRDKMDTCGHVRSFS